MRALALTAIMGLAAIGCGDDESKFGNDGGAKDGADPPFKGVDAFACKGLQCQQVNCGAQPPTSISGFIYDPAGKVPLYNIVVYVPNAPLAPIVDGASCDKCGATLSGDPIVATTTDAKGHFKLDNIPVGKDIPVVIQVGKWRRQITIPNVDKCVDLPLTDKNLTRLPKNMTEGHIPLIALTTGGADSLECFPRKIGLDDTEFSTNAGTGRVQLYRGTNGTQMPATTPSATGFWADVNQLKKYDMLINSCEGQEYPATKPTPARQALYDYANIGGRVFLTHFHYYWLENGIAEFPTTATFNHTTVPDPTTGFIDTSFPKGQAFADWMLNVGGSTVLGQFPIVEPRKDVTAINTATSVRWVYNTPQNAVFYYSFNTPIASKPEDQCGKVVFSDLHVSSGDASNTTWPNGCTTKDLSPQEKALEFLLFDLSSCIQKDDKPIIPPT